MKSLRDKTAFITGGATGIGFGIAKAFADAGMNIAVAFKGEQQRDRVLEYYATRPDVNVYPFPLDVTDSEAVARASADVARRFGKIHVLCNSAGVSLLGPADTATHEDWDWVLGANLKGVINTVISVVPHIKAHGEGGHVLNVASMAAFIAGPMSGVYAASKFAVRGFTESLRYNLAPHNIAVSLVCPGLTRTDIYASSLDRPAYLAKTAYPMDDDRLRQLRGVHAHGMDPDEVGRKTLEGMRRKDFYIFSHPEFRDEMRQLHEEIIAAMPEQENVDSERAAFEEKRRRQRAEAQAMIDGLRGE